MAFKKGLKLKAELNFEILRFYSLYKIIVAL